MRLSLIPTLAILPCLLLPGQAQAWVCSRAQDGAGQEVGPSLAWARRTVTYALYATGTLDISQSAEFDVLRQSYQVWSNVQECESPNRRSDFVFEEEPTLAQRDLVGYDFLHPEDNHNLAIFRDDAWPHPDQPATAIIALTTTTYSAQTGEILDADIEFNSANFDFTIGSINRRTDLMNTAVHEIGHVLGLGHPDAWLAIDPTCTHNSTMCSTASEGDIDKRDLACDDRDALVFKYPPAAANGYCAEPGCASGAEACGNCDGLACQSWAACGFCAPPTPLTRSVSVTATDSDDGMGGCGCASQSPFWERVLGVGLLSGCLWLGQRRRRLCR